MTSSPSNSSDRNPVEALAEEFLDRKRRSERPSLDEYCQRYAELAEEIRDLFPVLLQMEDLGVDGIGRAYYTSRAGDTSVGPGVILCRSTPRSTTPILSGPDR
jgi:hypothetical protein